MTKHKFNPHYAVAPGVTLRETLDDRGMTRRDLAEATGLKLSSIHRLIAGKKKLTPMIAECLSRALGMPANFWNYLERRYREHEKSR